MKKSKDTDKGTKAESELSQVERKLDSLYKIITSQQSRKAADELFNATDEELNITFNPQEKN
ncbi:MAG: hypothetical protein OQK95_12085 [Gammaproteobacteria bacterium]|nr:hypothetical protein [Gammaproteobacteria bacterium]MCW9030577.1 hypothetical protein [Gammaproteobacteria bacterium]